MAWYNRVWKIEAIINNVVRCFELCPWGLFSLGDPPGPSASDSGRMLGRVAWVVCAISRHIRLGILIEVVIEVRDFICALGLDGVWKLRLF